MNKPMERLRAYLGFESTAGLLWASSFILLTVIISLLWSHAELLWSDEFGILITDGVGSISRLLYVQRNYPISLDPAVYHLVAHGFIFCFGPCAMAIRVPSLVGYIVMQVCLFTFVRRGVNEKAALFALALTSMAGTLWYAGQGRPYGLLLGFLGLMMLSWQSATKQKSNRLISLLCLGLSTALALNTHYYAVLLLIPLCGAELFREAENRKPDWEMCSAIFAGVLGLVFLLPFLKGASKYSDHYYIKSVSGHIVSHSYMWMMIGDLNISKSMENHVKLLLILAAGLLISTSIYQTIRGKCELPKSELVFLMLISAVPLFGYVLAVLVTHVLETRFVLGAVVGLLSLLAIGMSIVFKHRLIVNAVMVTLFVTSLVSGVAKIRSQSATSRKVREWLVLPNETKDALHARQGQPVYLANWDVFEPINYYTRDPEIRKQFAMFYSMSLEKSCCGIGYDTMTRTMLNTQNITRTTVQSYEDVIKEPGEHLVYLPKSEGDWEWTRKALFASHAQMRTLGPMLDGDLVSVTSPSSKQ